MPVMVTGPFIVRHRILEDVGTPGPEQYAGMSVGASVSRPARISGDGLSGDGGPGIWASSMLSIVTPDAIRRHLLRPIVERFRGEGMEVANLRVVQIAPVQMYGVYESILVPLSDAYYALEARMGLGPSVVLRLKPTGPPSDIGHWYGRLKALKGVSTPSLAPPGTIRRDLGAINKILSLLHASDRPRLASREAGIVLGPDSGIECEAPRESVEALLDLTETMRPRETRGFCEVLAELRGCIVFRLWDELSDDRRARAVTMIGNGSIARPDAGAEIARHLREVSCFHPLTTILSAPFDGSRPPLDIASVLRHLSGAGIELDDWSRAVLNTSMYFQPRRDLEDRKAFP
jgi:nucleoside diphosphate kinase